MDPIERKPLPPPNANITTLTEGDRAEVLAHADEVIYHYLSGPGSYWDEGPRKDLEDTLGDLHAFHSQVLTSKQFADDPGRILDSVTGLVRGAIDRVERAIEDRDSITDRIEVPLPETNDRIVRPPPENAPAGKARPDLPADRGERPRIAIRFLSGRTVDGMPATALEGRAAAQSGMPQGVPLPGLVSGQPMSFYSVQPPIWDSRASSVPGDEAEDWLMRLLQRSGNPRRNLLQR